MEILDGRREFERRAGRFLTRPSATSGGYFPTSRRTSPASSPAWKAASGITTLPAPGHTPGDTVWRIQDRLPQRASAAVGCRVHQKRRQQGAVFHEFEPRPESEVHPREIGEAGGGAFAATRRATGKTGGGFGAVTNHDCESREVVQRGDRTMTSITIDMFRVIPRDPWLKVVGTLRVP